MPARTERSDEKLVRILQDACSVFARKGYHNASVRDVAGATGVSPAGLYYYFRSKEELLYLILEHSLTTLLTTTRQAMESAGDPRGRIHGLIRTYLEFFSGHGEEIRVLTREGEALTGHFREEIEAREAEYETLAVEALRALNPGASPEDLRSSVMALFGMLAWTHRWHRPAEDTPLEELTDRFSNLFLRGFLAEANAPSDTAPLSGGGPKATRRPDAKGRAVP